jgi:hypothetical protein
VSVSDLYIPRIGPHIFPCSRIGRLILEIYKSLTDTVCECRNRETEHYNSVLEMVGCLRAVIGIKIRDVRGLGVTQIGVGGGVRGKQRGAEGAKPTRMEAFTKICIMVSVLYM